MPIDQPALPAKVLIVGASGGIGGALARAFARSGAHLALAGRSEERLALLRADIDPAGERTTAIRVDVRDEQSVNVAIGAATRHLGSLDVVVIASGVSPIYKSAEEISVLEWDEILATNTRGAFLVARAAGQHMLARGVGSIIFVTSIYERVGGLRLAAYAASKGAVAQLARSLALDWADRGVRVNCIAPGYVRTELTAGLQSNRRLLGGLALSTPLGRMATPDEVAGAALFLASDAASYITGSTLFVDGGWTAR